VVAGIYAIRPGVDSVAVSLEVAEFEEKSIAFSRDGWWVAYVSNNTGGDQVYVRPFPDAGSGLVQVSTNGGYNPVWAHSGRELFYRNGANEMVAV
jgi:serine/threonine-protein kinase